jgi:hypothetical protein
LQAIKGQLTLGTENNIYCSENCKNICPLYNLKYDPNNIKIDNKSNPAWVRMVLKIANYQCEICGSKENLYAHHIIPVAVNPLLAEDIDNGVCLCKNCHYQIVHKLPGCSLSELKKNICKVKNEKNNF